VSVEEGGVHWVVAVDRDREDERSWVGHLMEEGLLMDSGRPWQILVGCREEMSTVWQGSWEVGPGPDCCSCWKLDMGQIAVAAGC
jgi:hypothetical protein